MQWRPFSAVVTAVLAVLAGTFFQIKHDRDLAVARAETQAARKTAALAVDVMTVALDYAEIQTAKADAAEAKAARHIVLARVPLPQLPDTCAPAVIALAQADSAYESEHQAAQELRSGLDTVVTAAVPLVAATEHLSDAAESLVKASKPSWLARLKPDVSITATVGIDPLHPEQGIKKVVGVGFGWRIL
jgi:hypothetical protein